MAQIAWIGLGVMGAPMAGHLHRAGHSVTVYNRTAAKAEAWLTGHPGARIAATPALAAEGAEFVFSCVGGDDDLAAVTLGPGGAFETLQPGAVFADHTTASATIAQELAAAAREKGAAFLDAPVSGGQSGAESGQLTVMAGGDPETFVRAKPLFESYAKMARLIGPPGSGQLCKMVNQICIAGLIQSLAEGIHFAQKAGLDLEAVMETISQGAAQSWQMENRWRTMAEGKFNFGFAVKWMRKDLAMCLDEGERNQAILPVTALVDRFYADIEAMGGSRWDTSSLIARLTLRDRRGKP